MIEITPQGAVLRDGDEIGNIEGDTCLLTAPVGPAIKGQIKKAAGRELTFGTLQEEVTTGTNQTPEPKRGLPPPPARHSQLGDKDPAYVEWFKANHSAEEFDRKYGNKIRPASMEEWRAKQNHITSPTRKLANEVNDSAA